MARKTNKKNRSSKLVIRRIDIGTSLTISILLHICVFLAIQVAFPTKNSQRPARTYDVNFLRTPADRIEEMKRNKTGMAGVKPTAKKPFKQTEDTISLDTKDKKYLPYVKVIRERLM